MQGIPTNSREEFDMSVYDTNMSVLNSRQYKLLNAAVRKLCNRRFYGNVVNVPIRFYVSRTGFTNAGEFSKY